MIKNDKKNMIKNKISLFHDIMEKLFIKVTAFLHAISIWCVVF